MPRHWLDPELLKLYPFCRLTGPANVLAGLTALKRIEQMRVDFIANASHELRTPLAAVLGFIETLRGPDEPAGRLTARKWYGRAAEQEGRSTRRTLLISLNINRSHNRKARRS